MPLVPRFNITQDDEFVFVRIRVPYVKVSDAELLAEDCDFSFYCKPYLLKLSFPHPFDGHDPERCRAVYDPSQDNGTITCFLPKLDKGRVFEDLDMLSNLLQKRVEKDQVPGIVMPAIEVLSSEDTYSEDADEKIYEDTPNATSIVIRRPRYGFNQGYSSILGSLQEDSVLELRGNPDDISDIRRRELRVETENKLFSAERYLGDYFALEDDEVFAEAMKYQTFWNIAWDARSNESVSTLEFSSDEQTLMLSLPRKEYLIDPNSAQEHRVLLGLVDILFAYCYDHRFSLGEHSVESPETISRLSPSLSWLDTIGSVHADTMQDVLIALSRRSLIYPYFRYWKYTRRVFADVAKVLFLGKRFVLKCLLNVYSIFEHTTEQYYLLNKLFIADYCVWIQSAKVSDSAVLQLANEFNEAKRAIEASTNNGRDMTGFNLSKLEEWAAQQMNNGGDISQQADIPEELLTYSFGKALASASPSLILGTEGHDRSLLDIVR